MHTFTVPKILLLLFGLVSFAAMVRWIFKMWWAFRLEQERHRPVIGNTAEIHIDERR
jgi:uncharacterized membrane protein